MQSDYVKIHINNKLFKKLVDLKLYIYMRLFLKVVFEQANIDVNVRLRK